jgi:tetratricopeptide (TPR) repeat protein
MAWKFIGYGDALFAKQKYAEANERYRSAARSAPQLGAAWFREGFALAAVGRCDLAAAAVKRGLKLDPGWPKSDFVLDQLFGPDKMAKNALLDALAGAVMAKPTDPNRLFVLAVCLHFDGQTDRAAMLLDRAEPFVGNNVAHIEAFRDHE